MVQRTCNTRFALHKSARFEHFSATQFDLNKHVANPKEIRVQKENHGEKETKVNIGEINQVCMLKKTFFGKEERLISGYSRISI